MGLFLSNTEDLSKRRKEYDNYINRTNTLDGYVPPTTSTITEEDKSPGLFESVLGGVKGLWDSAFGMSEEEKKALAQRQKLFQKGFSNETDYLKNKNFEYGKAPDHYQLGAAVKQGKLVIDGNNVYRTYIKQGKREIETLPIYKITDTMEVVPYNYDREKTQEEYKQQLLNKSAKYADDRVQMDDKNFTTLARQKTRDDIKNQNFLMQAAGTFANMDDTIRGTGTALKNVLTKDKTPYGGSADISSNLTAGSEDPSFLGMTGRDLGKMGQGIALGVVTGGIGAGAGMTGTGAAALGGAVSSAGTSLGDRLQEYAEGGGTANAIGKVMLDISAGYLGGKVGGAMAQKFLSKPLQNTVQSTAKAWLKFAGIDALAQTGISSTQAGLEYGMMMARKGDAEGMNFTRDMLKQALTQIAFNTLMNIPTYISGAKRIGANNKAVLVNEAIAKAKAGDYSQEQISQILKETLPPNTKKAVVDIEKVAEQIYASNKLENIEAVMTQADDGTYKVDVINKEEAPLPTDIATPEAPVQEGDLKAKTYDIKNENFGDEMFDLVLGKEGKKPSANSEMFSTYESLKKIFPEQKEGVNFYDAAGGANYAKVYEGITGKDVNSVSVAESLNDIKTWVEGNHENIDVANRPFSKMLANTSTDNPESFGGYSKGALEVLSLGEKKKTIRNLYDELVTNDLFVAYAENQYKNADDAVQIAAARAIGEAFGLKENSLNGLMKRLESDKKLTMTDVELQENIQKVKQAVGFSPSVDETGKKIAPEARVDNLKDALETAKTESRMAFDKFIKGEITEDEYKQAASKFEAAKSAYDKTVEDAKTEQKVRSAYDKYLEGKISKEELDKIVETYKSKQPIPEEMTAQKEEVIQPTQEVITEPPPVQPEVKIEQPIENAVAGETITPKVTEIPKKSELSVAEKAEQSFVEPKTTPTKEVQYFAKGDSKPHRLLDKVSKGGSDEVTRGLASVLKQYAKELAPDVKVVKGKKGERSYYDPQKNRIVIGESSNSKMIEYDVLHETTHAIIDKAITNPSTDAQVKASNELDNIRGYLEKNLSRLRRKDGWIPEYEYFITGESIAGEGIDKTIARREFVTGVFNPHFASILNDVKLSKGGTILGKIKDTIMKLLGFKPNEKSALQKALGNIVTLLDDEVELKNRAQKGADFKLEQLAKKKELKNLDNGSSTLLYSPLHNPNLKDLPLEKKVELEKIYKTAFEPGDIMTKEPGIKGFVKMNIDKVTDSFNYRKAKLFKTPYDFMQSDKIAEASKLKNAGMIFNARNQVKDPYWGKNKVMEYAEKFGIKDAKYDEATVTAIQKKLLEDGQNANLNKLFTNIAVAGTHSTQARDIHRAIINGQYEHGKLVTKHRDAIKQVEADLGNAKIFGPKSMKKNIAALSQVLAKISDDVFDATVIAGKNEVKKSHAIEKITSPDNIKKTISNIMGISIDDKRIDIMYNAYNKTREIINTQTTEEALNRVKWLGVNSEEDLRAKQDELNNKIADQKALIKDIMGSKKSKISDINADIALLEQQVKNARDTRSELTKEIGVAKEVKMLQPSKEASKAVRDLEILRTEKKDIIRSYKEAIKSIVASDLEYNRQALRALNQASDFIAESRSKHYIDRRIVERQGKPYFFAAYEVTPIGEKDSSGRDMYKKADWMSSKFKFAKHFKTEVEAQKYYAAFLKQQGLTEIKPGLFTKKFDGKDIYVQTTLPFKMNDSKRQVQMSGARFVSLLNDMTKGRMDLTRFRESLTEVKKQAQLVLSSTDEVGEYSPTELDYMAKAQSVLDVLEKNKEKFSNENAKFELASIIDYALRPTSLEKYKHKGYEGWKPEGLDEWYSWYQQHLRLRDVRNANDTIRENMMLEIDKQLKDRMMFGINDEYNDSLVSLKNELLESNKDFIGELSKPLAVLNKVVGYKTASMAALNVLMGGKNVIEHAIAAPAHAIVAGMKPSVIANFPGIALKTAKALKNRKKLELTEIYGKGKDSSVMSKVLSELESSGSFRERSLDTATNTAFSMKKQEAVQKIAYAPIVGTDYVNRVQDAILYLHNKIKTDPFTKSGMSESDYIKQSTIEAIEFIKRVNGGYSNVERSKAEKFLINRGGKLLLAMAGPALHSMSSYAHIMTKAATGKSNKSRGALVAGFFTAVALQGLLNGRDGIVGAPDVLDIIDNLEAWAGGQNKDDRHLFETVRSKMDALTYDIARRTGLTKEQADKIVVAQRKGIVSALTDKNLSMRNGFFDFLDGVGTSFLTDLYKTITSDSKLEKTIDMFVNSIYPLKQGKSVAKQLITGKVYDNKGNVLRDYKPGPLGVAGDILLGKSLTDTEAQAEMYEYKGASLATPAARIKRLQDALKANGIAYDSDMPKQQLVDELTTKLKSSDIRKIDADIKKRYRSSMIQNFIDQSDKMIEKYIKDNPSFLNKVATTFSSDPDLAAREGTNATEKRIKEDLYRDVRDYWYNKVNAEVMKPYIEKAGESASFKYEDDDNISAAHPSAQGYEYALKKLMNKAKRKGYAEEE